MFNWFESIIGYFSKKSKASDIDSVVVSGDEDNVVIETQKIIADGYEDNAVIEIQKAATDKPLDLMKVTFDKSPNQSERKDIVRAIVLHHTGPGTFNGIVNWLKDPNAKAAAHYVLGTVAELSQLVNTTKKAWHAGASTWIIDGVSRLDLNNCTIGIEICNVGILFEKNGKYYYENGKRDPVEWKGITPIRASITYPSGKILEGYVVPYPDVQVEKLIALCKALVKKYPNIGRENILTHFNISTPEGRKNDPFGLDIQYVIRRIFG